MYKEIAKKLYELFIVNKDVAAFQTENSYVTVRNSITESIIEQMLQSGYSLGTYQQLTNRNMLKWICFDFDCKERENRERVKELKKEIVDVFLEYLDSLEINYALEFSGRRGIHVWIFLDQIISKDLAFSIVKKLRQPIYNRVLEDKRFDLDCFPKTGSGKIKNKYGLQVKLPLSKHKLGTYSYFIEHDEETFEFLENLTQDILERQLALLNKIERTSVEYLVQKLGIEKECSNENIVKYHKQITIGEKVLTFFDVQLAFYTDSVLRNIWNRILDGQMSNLDRVIILGIFAHCKDTEDLLFEIFKRQQNYSERITRNMIEKYKNYYYPVSFEYLYELYGCIGCLESLRNVYIDEYIYRILQIPYTTQSISSNKDASKKFIQNIISKELNYFLYNDEVYDMQTFNQLKTFSYYDCNKIEEYISQVENGEAVVPEKIEYQTYVRKEQDKERILVSLGAKERVITTALVNKLIMYMQTDYASYSYHLNFGMEGDVFYPWISSWTRFKNDVSKYLSFPIFGEYICIKADIKNFYDSIYLQSMYKSNIAKREHRFVNVYKYLNDFNEKLNLSISGTLRGVPQGPAYARVLAEIVLDGIIKEFFAKYSFYQGVMLYRYVDDMFIFMPDDVDARSFIKDLSRYIEEYGLFLNNRKTIMYGKIKDLSQKAKQELKEFRELNYDIFQFNNAGWIDMHDKEMFDNVYLRYIYRKKTWDINDANVILSNKVSTQLQERFIDEFYNQILESEYGRGSIFRKFYGFIFSNEKRLNTFLLERDYERIPMESISYKNLLCMLIINFNDIAKCAQKKDYLLWLQAFLLKNKRTTEVEAIISLIENTVKEKE